MIISKSTPDGFHHSHQIVGSLTAPDTSGSFCLHSFSYTVPLPLPTLIHPSFLPGKLLLSYSPHTPPFDDCLCRLQGEAHTPAQHTGSPLCLITCFSPTASYSPCFYRTKLSFCTCTYTSAFAHALPNPQPQGCLEPTATHPLSPLRPSSCSTPVKLALKPSTSHQKVELGVLCPPFPRTMDLSLVLSTLCLSYVCPGCLESEREVKACDFSICLTSVQHRPCIEEVLRECLLNSITLCVWGGGYW